MLALFCLLKLFLKFIDNLTNITISDLSLHYLYETADGRLKRFFDEKDIQKFFADWEKLYIHEEVMGRYDAEKVLWRGAFKVNK